MIRSIIREPEESYIEDIVALLKAGRSPKSILDAIQIAAARVVLECGLPANFSMPQHGYEYTNMLGWFFENFDHPHRTKLLFIAANFINQCAHWVTNSKGNKTRGAATYFAGYGLEADADPMSQGKLLGELNDSLLALDTEQSVYWTDNYLKQGLRRWSAGRDARRRHRQAGQRSSQPGNRPLHARGLPPHVIRDA